MVPKEMASLAPVWLVLFRGVYALSAMGIGITLVDGSPMPEVLIAIALLLFLPDCCRMAIVDLRKYWQVIQVYPVSLVRPFLFPVVVAIGSEVLGLYLAWVSLGWGIIVILAGQLWFNLAVPITLKPISVPPIQPWPLRDRLIVIVADAIALFLACYWTVSPAIWSASLLLAIILAYLGLKYAPLLLTRLLRSGATQAL